MFFFLWTAYSGWIAVLLLGGAIAMPYLARSSVRARLLPHYIAGFSIPAVTILHAWLPVSTGRMGAFNMIGLAFATAALIFMISQTGLGLALRAASGSDRARIRRTHFWMMATVVGLVAGHVMLNRIASSSG